MGFIKRGDGKILNIFDEKDLSDDQKVYEENFKSKY